MKIVNDLPEGKHEVERQQEERRVPNEFRFDGRIRRTPGHTLFSYNVHTEEWKVADVERKVAVDIKGKEHFITNVKREAGCVYIQALNLKNAQKKMARSIQKLSESQENG